MWSEPKIDIRIPYEPKGRLGEDYNRIMNETTCDWVLFLDNDVLVSLHPNWYHVCQSAIRNFPNAGLFTTWTNSAGHDFLMPDFLTSDYNSDGKRSMKDHRQVAKKIWKAYGYQVTNLESYKIGGFFHLISKAAWEEVGGHPGVAQFHEDHVYCEKLIKSNRKIYRIDGLYVWHMGSDSGMREPTWVENEKGTYELYKDWRKIKDKEDRIKRKNKIRHRKIKRKKDVIKNAKE